MDEELKKLEAELKRLRPVAPSLAVAARIERELTRPARRPRPAGRMLWWVALPLAAAVALVWNRRSDLPAPGVPARVPAVAAAAPGPGAAGDEAAFKPVGAENVLVSARDEGVVTLADGTMARRERLQYVDTITWRNSRTRASLQWSVPREEVRIVPIVFQ